MRCYDFNHASASALVQLRIRVHFVRRLWSRFAVPGAKRGGLGHWRKRREPRLRRRVEL